MGSGAVGRRYFCSRHNVHVRENRCVLAVMMCWDEMCEKNSFPAFGLDFDPNPGGSTLRVDLPYLPIC